MIEVLLLVCVPEAQGTCDVFAYCASISRLKRTYDTRHSHDALIIDALIAGRRFLPRHIHHIPTHPHYTLTQAANTIAQWEIYIMEIPQSQTKCSLYNSISGATDYCTVHGVLYTVGMARGAMAPPEFKLVGPAIHLAPPEFLKQLSIYSRIY